jgi:hypothetical protein
VIRLFHDTGAYWQRWLEQSSYQGRWREAVERSARAAEPPSAHPVAHVVWRSELLADASVDPLTQQVGVTEVAGVLVDHLDQHLTQRYRPLPGADAPPGLAGDVEAA